MEVRDVQNVADVLVTRRIALNGETIGRKLAMPARRRHSPRPLCRTGQDAGGCCRFSLRSEAADRDTLRNDDDGPSWRSGAAPGYRSPQGNFSTRARTSDLGALDRDVVPRTLSRSRVAKVTHRCDCAFEIWSKAIGPRPFTSWCHHPTSAD